MMIEPNPSISSNSYLMTVLLVPNQVVKEISQVEDLALCMYVAWAVSNSHCYYLVYKQHSNFAIVSILSLNITQKELRS